MLSIIKLADAEYAIGQVALGIEEYYLGEGEAPGVWAGRWAKALGLEGVVEAAPLRALVNGVDPRDGTWWLEGRPARKVNAFDATFSAPKSVSLLWAFGSPEVSSIVARAHVQAVTEALALLEARAAVSRQQTDGVRSRVGTAGWAVATFQHRTSSAGDPQLHTHCVIPNVVARPGGSYASLDAAALYTWGKPSGCVYQEQLRRILTEQLGVEWGPDRNGTREIVGFTPVQLRKFSKRSSQIEAYLERSGGVYQTAVHRMRADHRASLATRPDKDRTLTPERLRDRWAEEAAEVGLVSPVTVEAAVVGRAGRREPASWEQIVECLCDLEAGLCAHDSRFGEAQVVERIASLGAGTLTVADIERLTADFLASRRVVRLSVDLEEARRTPPQFTTTAQLALESRVLECIDDLIARMVPALDHAAVEDAVTCDGLGDDQAAAVRALCADAPALRTLPAPPGYGKTTSVHAAAVAATDCGRPVLGVATTNRAVAELRDVGLPAVTIARLAIDLTDRPLAPGTIVVLDETSQTSTRDAEVVLNAVADTPDTQLWCLGDVRQAQAVGAGGLAAELERLGTEGRIPAPSLAENRRQQHPAERQALAAWRAGELTTAQAIRAEAGLEHEHATPTETREAMADAVAADILTAGPRAVVALAVSHADCEDLADRIRARLTAAGKMAGPAMEGPGWGSGEPRRYQAGDLVLLHTNLRVGGAKLANGTALTVTGVTETAVAVTDHHDVEHTLPAEFVTGTRQDGRPNLSHGWCRTVDGAQGGTWDQAHLLGTAALDNFTAYVGQSRARVETHTWNVTRLPAGDWGGQLADHRNAAEQVLSAAAGRAEPKTFAAHDDPWALDRQLMAEIDAHQAVLVAGPPDVTDLLAQARAQLAATDEQIADARARLARAERGLAAEIGPVAALRRDNRQRRDRWGHVASDTRHGLADADRTRARHAAEVAGLERAYAARQAWEPREAWRVERISALRDQLGHHWAQVVLGAIHQGDPLAYGIDRLRHARATIAVDLARLEIGLPPDRREHLDQAEFMLRQLRGKKGWAVKGRDAGSAELAEAGRRRFGRRDPTAIADARYHVRSNQGTIERLDQGIAELSATISAERAATDARARAEAAISDERRTLTRSVETVDQSLESTRTDRVLAAADGYPDGQPLRDLLGPAPAQPAGRAAWYQIAERVEHGLDDPDELARYSWSHDPLDRLVTQLIERGPYAQRRVQTFIDAAGQAVESVHRERDPVGRAGLTWHSLPSQSRDQGLDLGL